MTSEELLGRLRRPKARSGLGARRGRVAAMVLRPKLLIALAVLALALGGGWLWLRDSSLVAVKRVTVNGQSGADGARIRRALIASARSMTTLDVRIDQLRTAVAPFPVVKDLQVSTQFPHGLKIHVIEQNPVGAVVADGRTVAVAGDGTLLHDVSAGGLPAIPVRVSPGGSRLSDRAGRDAVALLAAAPYQLLSRISQVSTVATHGLVAQIRNGPSVYFGAADQLGAKWKAATAVLADAGSVGALYIDVTDPERPAAGAGSPSASGSASAAGSGSPSAPANGGTSSTSAGTIPGG